MKTRTLLRICTHTFAALLLAPDVHAGISAAQSLWQFDDSLTNSVAGGGALVPSNFSPAYAADVIGGRSVRVLDVPVLNHTGDGLTMPVTGGGNGGNGATLVNQWSLIMDVKFVGTLNPYSSLIQANGGDAEVFVTDDGRLYFNTKNAAEKSAAGVIAPLQWNRIAITCGNDGAGGPLTVRGFVNGVKVFENTVQDFDGNFGLSTSAVFFGDNSGETSALHFNSAAFWRETLPETSIAYLGGPAAGGIPLGYLVTNNADTGTGSLRSALTAAYSAAVPDNVIFDPAVFTGGAANTIALSSQIAVNGSGVITVDAHDIPSGVTIDGGLQNFGLFLVQNGSTLMLDSLTLANGGGAGFGGYGGAIQNKGTLTLTRCTLSTNSTTGSNLGGAIYNELGTLTLTQCSLSGNSAGYGGAIYNFFGTLALTHCTLSANTATFSGGAIYNESSALTLTHSIVAGNTAAFVGADIRNFNGGITTYTRVGANLVQIVDNAGTVTESGPAALTAAPLLAPLGNYGGPTKTFALLPGSPCINAATGSTITTDQRGYPVVDNADLGAFEASIIASSPAHAATIVFANPTLSWTGPAGATFEVFLGSTSGSLTSLGAPSPTTAASFPLPNQLVVGTYYWRVDATVGGSTITGPEFSFTVQGLNSTADSGAGSLRDLLTQAAAHAGPDVIVIDPSLDGQTITLSSELLIDDNSGAVTMDASALGGGLTITDTGDVNYRLLHVNQGSTLTVKGVTFANGGGASFAGDGGAILNSGTLTLERCQLTGCMAAAGGAIANEDTWEGGTLVTLTECTLRNNAAGGGGGAIYNHDVGSNVATHLVLTGCTFANNLGSGSSIQSVTFGLFPHLAIEATNCTFSGDVLNLTGKPDVSRPVASFTHCTIAGSVSGIVVVDTILGGRPVMLTNSIVSSVSATIKPIQVGSNLIGGNPLLQPLGNYGGPTQTMPPLPGSLAIDQASVLNPALTTDQRGLPRPVGLRPDIGAVEGSVIVVTTPVDELDAPGALGAGVSLREAVRDIPAGGTIVFDRAVFDSPTTNTLTLTKGPLNPQRNCTLYGALNPGGITIVQTPTITAQPLPQSLASGGDTSFAITVTNLSGGVAYQWRKDGSDMAGQTNATLMLDGIQQSDESFYDVRLSEAASPGALTLNNVVLGTFAATSQPASLIVDGAPVYIQRGPISAMLALGSSYTLSVVAIGPATPALTYQWFKAGKSISGATKSSYVITNAQLSHAGAYSCLVKSGTVLPGVASTTAEIGVVDTRPKTVNLKVGGSTTISVSAAGNGLQPFAWRRDSTGLAFTSSSFPIKPAATGDAGLYTCTVSGLAGSISMGCNTQLNVSSAAPALVTPLTLPPASIGQAYFYQLPVVSTTGAPATSFSLSGSLPSGMSFNSTTGVLSGRPTTTKTGGYALSFKAINAFASSTAAPATLTVNTVPATAVGTFAGPMLRSALNDNLGGRFDLTTSANGTFSGGITLGARSKISFTNQLLLSAGTGDVILRGNLTGITLADKTPLTAYVEVFANDQRAVLTLVHPTNGTTLITTAWRNPWLLSKTPALNNPANAYAAYYTGRLDGGTATNAPQGYGYTNFTVSTSGTLTLAGKLADGSAISGGSFVSKDGEIALFNLLYSNRGSHVGQFVITPASPVTNNVLTGTTTWNKPAPLTATSTDTVYKDGFNALTVTTDGGVYVAPGNGALVPGFSVVAAGNNNAKLNFTLGGLNVEGKEFAQLLRLYNPSTSGTSNNATIGTPLNYTTKMTKFTASSGLFEGNYTIPGASSSLNRNAPFYGQLVKVGATTQGYGYFLLPKEPVGTEKVTTSPKLSGRVVLGVP